MCRLWKSMVNGLRGVTGAEFRWDGRRKAPTEPALVARPTGVGRALTAYRMPIEGRDEWLAAARLGA
jgi:hypothetical protein